MRFHWTFCLNTCLQYFQLSLRFSLVETRLQHSKKSWDGLQDASHTWQGPKELWRSEEFAFGTRSAAIFFNADIGSRGVCRGRDVAVLGDEDNLKEFESSTILRTRSSRRMAPKMETAVQSWQCRGMGDEECWSTSQMHDTCSLSSESLDWRQLQVCKRQQKTDPSMHRSQTSGCSSWVSRGRNDTDRVDCAHHTHRKMIQGPVMQ